jgi:hypothetical protein
MDTLRRRIRERFGCERPDEAAMRWWTVRQRAILERAITEPAALAEAW